MITTKTVLVLGAGASQPYGFPVGSVLVSQLQSVGVARQLERAGVAGEFKQFSEVLGAAQPYSIDEFLENRPEFSSVGTMAITACLLPAEHRSLKELNDLSKTDHWYRYLKAHLSGPFQELGKNQLRIITFNYDRSLEHYLFTTSCHTYGKSAGECAIQLAPIEILHVYGSLGPLPWQQAADPLPYGPADVTGRVIIQARQNIKVMHEGLEDTVQGHFEKAKKWLQWADRILFLGFGFHDNNVKRLDLARILRKDQKISGTCLGLDHTSRNKVVYCTSWALRPENLRPDLSPIPTIYFPDNDAKCHDFLCKYADLS